MLVRWICASVPSVRYRTRAVSTPLNGFTRRHASSLATCPDFHARFKADFRPKNSPKPERREKMARTVRDANLETRTARLRLPIRSEPYWPALAIGPPPAIVAQASNEDCWRRGEPIEWTFRQIAISAVRILKRGQFRSIRERSFFSFSNFWGFHTAEVKTRTPFWTLAFPLPPAADMPAHLLGQPSARTGLMHRSKQPLYSITSSAVASSCGGTVRSSIMAVWALITSSNLLDCTTGKSAGLAPLRMRPE